MIKGVFPADKFQTLETPFYYYDIYLLRQTLECVKQQTDGKPYHIHYAVKANANSRILKEIAAHGFGADCVSGNEIKQAIACGFSPSKIVFAGVGKTDKEIRFALENNIFCFNVESLPELQAIAELAHELNKCPRIALRINPNVDAHTHKYITTGTTENKFGINENDVLEALQIVSNSPNLQFEGLHFHIGSQITDLSAFQNLCIKIETLQEDVEKYGYSSQSINVGGGLGINYEHPNHCPIADFESYFRVFDKYLKRKDNQTIHFELGRSIVAPCGTLVSRVVYVKNGIDKNFVILDAGLNNLIRPALYQAYHHIENISSDLPMSPFDVVGPICESSDVFGRNTLLNKPSRHDLIAIRSAGAYGEIMSSQYNCRDFALSYFSDTL